MRRLIRIAIATTFCTIAMSATAQPKWKVDFSELQARAEESVEISLDGNMLRLATKFLSSENAEEREIREVVKDLSGIYIYSFTFDRDWDYDRKVAETVRKQIGTGWEKMVTVRSRTSENVDIWVRPGGDKLEGIFLIAAEPREFTVVNIVGTIDINQLSRLQGQFGIPELDLEETRTVERKINR